VLRQFEETIIKEIIDDQKYSMSDQRYGFEDLKKEINYPYYCKYGILNQPFDDKLLFKNLEEAPLGKSENMMSDIMIKIIEDPIFRKKYSNGQKMSEKFDEEEIMKKWEKLLKK